MGKLKNIFLASLKHWREISFIYFIQLLMGLTVGLTFCSVMYSSLDSSMALDQLAKGFDRTVVMDVINSNDALLDFTKSLVLVLLGLYLLVSIFLQGGWLANINTKEYSIKTLIKNGFKLFLPFLGIALLSILLIGVFGTVVGISFTMIIGDPLVTFSSEKPYVIWIVFLTIVFMLWLIIIWAWSVSARFYYINNNTFLASLKLGFRTIRKNFLKFIGIGVLLISINIILMFLYYLIMGDRGASSWLIVLFGIIVQQTFAFVRVALRGLGYSMVGHFASSS